MNEFRKQLLGGAPTKEPLLRNKEPKAELSRAAEDESFAELVIPRTSGRAANHRDDDRHRLVDECATLLVAGERHDVDLINLSGGGAMIEGNVRLQLWDKIELELGGCHRLEAIVRWVKGQRFGLEFAHETRIDTGSEKLADTLRAVMGRSFSDVALAVSAEKADDLSEAPDEPGPSTPEDPADSTREVRHPLIWSGLVHFNHDSSPIRLRNISSGGAMVEGTSAFPVGAELLLDLGEAGAIFASVHWARGDQAGLKFHSPYDVTRLAEARPEVAAARWVAPDYLREDRGGNSPWAAQWGRHDLASLQRSLTGLKSAIRRR